MADNSYRIIFYKKHISSAWLRASWKRGDNDNDHPGHDKNHHRPDKGNGEPPPRRPPPDEPPSPPPNTDSPNLGPSGGPSAVQPSPPNIPNGISPTPASSSSIVSQGSQAPPVSTGSPLAYSYSPSIPTVEPATTSGLVNANLPSSSSSTAAAAESSATVASSDASTAMTRTINIAAITGAILAAIFILVAIRVLYAMFRRPRQPTTERPANSYPFSPEFQPALQSRSFPSMDTTLTPASVPNSFLRQ